MDNFKIGLPPSDHIRWAMTKTLYSERHSKLVALLAQHRKAAGLTQIEVAVSLDRRQPHVANIESGDRRIDVVEFLKLAEVIGFDPHQLLDELLMIQSL